MLDLDEFKNTLLYDILVAKIKAKTELQTKLKLAPKCVEKGMSVQEMAELLEIDIEVIRKYLRENF
ncbi:hypothetical protein FACHB389_19240 [Nostoc calcicola FACHB-389]|nr:hypothetical protein [Nostoc calcicola FACHB-3891]MDZ8060616.1 hypothetical protein [Nostoc sp. EkiNYC01]OKH32792.1 hypothetical protein FACHB389_19240 [Nostoc calcicola FACHB-389]